jgi:hypothetical protein
MSILCEDLRELCNGNETCFALAYTRTRGKEDLKNLFKWLIAYSAEALSMR